MPLEQWVRLNVGGKIVHTRHATLTSQPSMLRDLALCDFDGVPRDVDGIPHFDRDPSSFLHLLNFLRGYHLDLSPEDAVMLLEDASYFRMPTLADHICSFHNRDVFLPGPGVSSDGKQFSSVAFVGHCGGFVSKGTHSVVFHLEKVLDGMGVGVATASGDTWDKEVLGRSGTVCYSHTGELMMHMNGRLTVTPGVKWIDGDFVKVEISFSLSCARVTFTKGTKVVVHSVDVDPQPLRILAWVQTQGGCMVITETSAVD